VEFWKRGNYILNPANFEKESCHHYSEKYVEQLITHELCHSLFKIKFGNSSFFPWINEGISLCVAGQLDKFNPKNKFKGFLARKVTPKTSGGIYVESGNAINLLIKNFGKEKLFELLKRQTGVAEEKELKKLFKQIYGSNLGYNFFNKLLKKQKI